MPRWLYFLLIFAIVAPILAVLHVSSLLIFGGAGDSDLSL
jgi:hypothetical protein